MLAEDTSPPHPSNWNVVKLDFCVCREGRGSKTTNMQLIGPEGISGSHRCVVIGPKETYVNVSRKLRKEKVMFFFLEKKI